jgi:hypothetical protein
MLEPMLVERASMTDNRNPRGGCRCSRGCRRYGIWCVHPAALQCGPARLSFFLLLSFPRQPPYYLLLPMWKLSWTFSTSGSMCTSPSLVPPSHNLTSVSCVHITPHTHPRQIPHRAPCQGQLDCIHIRSAAAPNRIALRGGDGTMQRG